jgi:hypothetical protein
MTLFDQISGSSLFKAALMRFYRIDDQATLDILAGWNRSQQQRQSSAQNPLKPYGS